MAVQLTAPPPASWGDARSAAMPPGNPDLEDGVRTTVPPAHPPLRAGVGPLRWQTRTTARVARDGRAPLTARSALVLAGLARLGAAP